MLLVKASAAAQASGGAQAKGERAQRPIQAPQAAAVRLIQARIPTGAAKPPAKPASPKHRTTMSDVRMPLGYRL